MKFRYGVTVTRLRRQLVPDPYSSEPALGDWSSASELPIPGCAVVPVSSDEAPTVDRAQLSTLATIFAPYGTDIQPEDRVRTPDGVVWSVEGHPAHWRNAFTGWTPATVINLRRWEARG